MFYYTTIYSQIDKGNYEIKSAFKHPASARQITAVFVKVSASCLCEASNQSNSKIFIEAFISIELSLIGINQEVINKKEETNISQICQIILDPWIKSRSDIFNFLDGNAMYNVAVYS